MCDIFSLLRLCKAFSVPEAVEGWRIISIQSSNSTFVIWVSVWIREFPLSILSNKDSVLVSLKEEERERDEGLVTLVGAALDGGLSEGLFFGFAV